MTRFPSLAVLPGGLLCLALLFAPAARAGLFDDSEARAQIDALKKDSSEKIDTLTRGQLELSTQILGLREELAQLRGMLETLSYENEQSRKRQQDFYLDLDNRLRNLEIARIPVATAAAAADPSAENREYENALTLFKNGKYGEAASAFDQFVAAYPESTMAPNAQFWLGNAWYAQNKCKETIEAQLVVANRWPDSARAPDALLAIAECQRDWGNVEVSRRTLKNLVEKYPSSPAATTARQRLAN
ncbi:MAG: tol-pal system protein YbgF [Zoogloeaceae bacterium]|jgi:tol-pal system protein YbgF|nr:tol-pal system protein YbgF [Zoogloeaceae bacterium]